MTVMIERYTIRRGPFEEYELYDNARGLVLISTEGLCLNEKGEVIAKKVIDYALQLVNTEDPIPRKHLNKVAYIAGTTQSVARDDKGNTLILDINDEIIKINDETPSVEQAVYYGEEYGLTVKETTDSSVNRILNSINNCFK